MVFDISRVLFRSLRGLKPTGIDVVTLRYVNFYSEKASFFVYRKGFFYFFSDRYSREIARTITQKPKNFIFEIIKFFILSIPTNLRKKNYTHIVNLGHIGLEHKIYFKKSKKYAKKIVTLLHDLIPIRNPNYCTIKQTLAHKKRILNSIKLSDKIITISKYVKNDLLKYIEENKLEFNNHIDVLYPGSTFEGKDINNAKYSQSSSNYHLMIGTIEGRKKYDFILKFLEKEAQSNININEVIIVGQKGWSDEEFNKLFKKDLIKKHVQLLHDCDDEELIGLYKNCKAVVFPSEAEGFGLPLIDAMFFKKPILANQLDVFKEIAGDYPYYFNNKSHKSFKKSLQLSETFNYENHSKAELPTWSNHFRDFERAIK